MIGRSQLHLFLWLTLVSVAMVGCAGRGQSAATPTESPPTHTPFPTFAFVEPTKAPEFEQAGDEPDKSAHSAVEVVEDEIALDPKMVERGLGRYEALECGSCHGVNGEGTDKASSLRSFAMFEDDFITFVRTGGELGTAHQYSTDRLSNSGSRNLYQYLVSLARSG